MHMRAERHQVNEKNNEMIRNVATKHIIFRGFSYERGKYVKVCEPNMFLVSKCYE